MLLITKLCALKPLSYGPRIYWYTIQKNFICAIWHCDNSVDLLKSTRNFLKFSDNELLLKKEPNFRHSLMIQISCVLKTSPYYKDSNYKIPGDPSIFFCNNATFVWVCKRTLMDVELLLIGDTESNDYLNLYVTCIFHLSVIDLSD